MVYSPGFNEKKPHIQLIPPEQKFEILPESRWRRCMTILLFFVFPVVAFTLLILGNVMCFNENRLHLLQMREANQINSSLNSVWESHYGSFLMKYYSPERQKIRKPLIDESIFSFDLPSPPIPGPDRCSNIAGNDKFDCLPRGEVSEKACTALGCCYEVANDKVPYCFYPKQYNSYRYSSFMKTQFGYNATLAQQFKSPYPKDIPKLFMDVQFISNEVLLIKITDEKNTRYESPVPELPTARKVLEAPLYRFYLNPNSTGFKIVRSSNNLTIFDSEDVGGFIFSDQFIQFSARIPTNNIFGLGDSRHAFRVGTEWRTITMHNHDRTPTNNVNGYGSHPMYLGLEPDGSAHGVFVSTSYSMDVVLQPSPAITYRILGGPLIIGVFLGPTPLDVNSQYVSTIGRPHLPPYWSLGFHLCRFGYKSLDKMEKIWNQTRTAGIPFDTQWTDLDYMKNRNDFTIDDVAFKNLTKFVDNLHAVGMHYVILIDPGVSGGEEKGKYPPFDEGLKSDIFIKDPSGKKPLYGKVWNYKSTVFPDFSHPQVIAYWLKMIRDFHSQLNFDGAWIDMNEPSNMIDGSLDGCPNNMLENPPYVPGVDGGKLNYKTICMSAKHHDVQHYALHNVYATLEAAVTAFSMLNVRNGMRPLVISRASSPGLGHYAGHWSGDVMSTWDDMAQSISDMFSFSLFGIPLIGADICGFNGNTTTELCTRWHQLGAFYPFSRNHNTDDGIDQDPVSLGIQDVVAKVFYQRYFFLPYLYSLFWEAHVTGAPVVRPTFYLSPKDTATYDLEEQFLWGDGLLIAPVLKQGFSFVTPYLPKGKWYYVNEWSKMEGTVMSVTSTGQRYSIPSPQSSSVPVLARGGRIIPCQKPAQTTTDSRKNPFCLLVALDNSNSSFGSLFIDDGETFDGNYNLINFEAKANKLNSKIIAWQYDGDASMTLGQVTILGNFTHIKSVDILGKPLNFTFIPPTVLIVETDWSLKNIFTISWS